MRTIANNTDGSIIIDAKIDRSQIPAEFAELQKQIQQELDKLQQVVDGLATNFDELNKATKAVETGLEGVKTEVEGVGKGFQESEEKATGFRKKTTDAVTQVAQTMQSMRIQELVNAIADAFTECAAASIEFESAMTGVFKTINGTDEQLRTIEQGIRDMSTELPSSASEIAAVAEAAGQLGVTTEGILGFTEVMINLGEATNLTADEAASSLAKFANVTGMLESDYTRLGSVVVALGNTMATTEADIVAMGTRIASAGEQVGLTEDQIMGMAAALSSVGLEAEAGGTAISKLMIDMKASASMADETADMLSKTGMSVRELEMLADTSATEFKALANELGYTSTELKDLVKQRGQLEKFAEIAGMTADQFVDAFGKDAAKTMATFFEGLGSGSEDAITILNELGIEEVRLRDTMLRLTSASDLFAQAQSTAASAWEDNIALAEEANKRYETTESKIAMLGNAFNDLKISVGDVFSDTINNAVEWLTDITLAASEFVQENPEIVKALGLLAGAIAGIGIAVAGAMAITSLISALSGMGALVGIVSGVGAAIGVFTTAVLGMKFDTEVESVRDLTTALRDAKEGFAEADKVFDTTAKNVNATSQAANVYIDKLEALEKAGLGSAEAQDEYARTVAKLQTLMPELNITLDQTTGKIEGGTSALREQIEAWKEAAEAQAYYAAYQQKLDLLVAAELEVSLNEQKVADIEAEMDRLKAIYDSASAKAFGSTEYLKNDLGLQFESDDALWEFRKDMTTEADEAIAKYQELEEARKNALLAVSESELVLPDLQAQVDTAAKFVELSQQMQEVATTVDTSLQGIAQAVHNGSMTLEEGAAVYGFAVSEIETEVAKLEEAQKKADQAANFDNAIAAIEDLAAAYSENLENAVETVDNRFGLLAELPKKLKTSFDEITKNLQDQQKYWDDYSAGLQKLEEAGLGEKVMQKLSDGTEESVGIVAALVTEIENLGGVDSAKVQAKIDEINTSFDGLEKSKTTVATTMAEIQTEFDTRLAAILESSGVIGTGSGEALVTAMKDALITNGGQINEGAVTSIVSALNQTIIDTEDDSQAVGKAITDGIRIGLESAQGDLTKASMILGESIIGALKEAVDSNSPSKRARDEVGITIPQGVAVGIEDGTKTVAKACKELADESTDALKEAFDETLATIKQSLERQFEIIAKIPEKGKSVFDAIKENIRDQSKAWEEYKKGLETLKAAGLVENLLGELSDGTEKSVETVRALVLEIDALGGAASESVKKHVQEINASFATLGTSQDAVAQTMTDIQLELAGDIEQAYETLKETSNQAGNDITSELANAIMEKSPDIGKSLYNVIQNASEETLESLKQFIIDADMATQLKESLGENANVLGQAIEHIFEQFEQIGRLLVQCFIFGFEEQLPEFRIKTQLFFEEMILLLSNRTADIVRIAMSTLYNTMQEFFPTLFGTIVYIVENVPKLIDDLTTKTMEVVAAATNMLLAIINTIHNYGDMLAEAGAFITEKLIEGFRHNEEEVRKFIQWAILLLLEIVSNDKSQGLFMQAIGILLNAARTAVERHVQELNEAGSLIVQHITDGIKAQLEEDDGGGETEFLAMVGAIAEAAAAAVDEYAEGFEAAGKMIPQYIAAGILSGAEEAVGAINSLMEQLASAAAAGAARIKTEVAIAYEEAAKATAEQAQGVVAGGSAYNVTNNNSTTYNVNYSFSSSQLDEAAATNLTNTASQRIAMGII